MSSLENCANDFHHTAMGDVVEGPAWYDHSDPMTREEAYRIGNTAGYLRGMAAQWMDCEATRRYRQWVGGLAAEAAARLRVLDGPVHYKYEITVPRREVGTDCHKERVADLATAIVRSAELLGVDRVQVHTHQEFFTTFPGDVSGPGVPGANFECYPPNARAGYCCDGGQSFTRLQAWPTYPQAQ